MGQATSAAADPYALDTIEDTVFTPLPRNRIPYRGHPYFTQDFFRKQLAREKDNAFPGNDGGYKAAGSLDDIELLDPILEGHQVIPIDSGENPILGPQELPIDSGVDSGSCRVRRESESTTTTGGNTSTATDHSVPAITITECSDTDTDFEFQPTLTSERKDDSDRKVCDVILDGKMISLKRQEESTVPKGQTPASPGTNRASKSVNISSHGTKKGIFRRKSSGSESSAQSSRSSKSSKSPGVVKKKLKRKELENKKRKSMLGANAPKGSLNDKWQDLVEEYQDAYVEGKQTEKKKDHTKVNKLPMDRYDSVKQVFGRGPPLAYQTAPPGGKAQDLEAHGAAMGVNRYDAAAPMAYKHSNILRPSSTAHVSSGGRKSNVVAGRTYTNHEISQGLMAKSTKVPRDSQLSEAQNPDARHSSSRNLDNTQIHGHTHTARVDNQRSSQEDTHSQRFDNQRQTSSEIQGHTKRTSDNSKKGVKFHRRIDDLEDEAQVIVDDAVEAALRLLYGSPSSSRKLRHSSHNTTSAASSGQHSSRHSSTDQMRQNTIDQRLMMQSELQDLTTVEHHYHHRQGRHSNPIVDHRKSRASSSHLAALPPPMTRSAQHTSSINKHSDNFYEIGIAPYAGLQTTQEHEIQEDTNTFERISTQSINVFPGSTIHVKDLSDRPQPQTTIPQPTTAPKKIQPPTLTKGTITRILHGCEASVDKPSARKVLSNLREVPEEDHSTNTWPMDKSERYAVTTEIRADPPYNTLPLSSRPEVGVGEAKVSYSLENVWLSGQLGNLPDQPPPRGLDQSYQAGMSYMAPTAAASDTDTMRAATYVEGYSSLPLQPAAAVQFSTPFQTNTLPLGSSAKYQVFQGPSQPALQTLPSNKIYELDAGAYSNEPVIVADLLDKPGKMPDISPYGGDPPLVNMDKQSIINFYVFNQQQRPDQRTTDYANMEVGNDINYSDFNRFMDLHISENINPRQRAEITEFLDQREYNDIEPQEMREETIYHKQTQTLPPTRKKAAKQMKSAPIIYPPPQYIMPQPSLSRETTHYITKERQIEKLPTPPPKSHACDFSTQTDISGTLSKYRGANVIKQKIARDEPDAVQITRTISAPRITETRQRESHYSAPPPLPTAPVLPIPPLPAPVSREIPLQVRPSAVASIHEMLERETYRHQVDQPDAAPIVEDIGPEDDEEEIIETIEVEEREQRLCMSIFEELEFNLQRTQGGQREGQTSKASELVPWIFPDRYDATVDRRRQKSTQIREVKKGAGQSRHYTGPDATMQQMLTDNKQEVLDSLTESMGDQGSTIRETVVTNMSNIQNQSNHATAGSTPVTTSSSGYSSADNVHVSSKKEIIVNSQGITDGKTPSSPESPKRRHVSRFDPENVYYTVPEWTSMDEDSSMLKLSGTSATVPSKVSADDESLPDSLPDTHFPVMPGVGDGMKSTGSQSAPQIRTRIVKDADGNLMKVTEVEQTMTKTVDYKQEYPHSAEQPRTVGLEQLGGTQYIDMNLLASPDDDPEPSESGASDAARPSGPEVVAETSQKLTPVEYSEQTRTIGLKEEDINLTLRLREAEEQEKSMGVADDDELPLAPSQFLYDMRTATLRPQVTRDMRPRGKSPHRYGDMSTQL